MSGLYVKQFHTTIHMSTDVDVITLPAWIGCRLNLKAICHMNADY